MILSPSALQRVSAEAGTSLDDQSWSYVLYNNNNGMPFSEANTLQQTSDLVVRGWEERQKGFDARVGKRSDATLGYERVVEKDSGRVYRAYNGFLDASENQRRFEAAPDEAYSRPIDGTIDR